MATKRELGEANHDFPGEFADRFTRPLARFLEIQSATGIILLVATAAALIASNSPWSSNFLEFWETRVGVQIGPLDLGRSLRHWINDGCMTLFFFVVALELKREIIQGELRTVRMAAFSFAGAVGGMLVPASLYYLVMNGQPGAHGWGTVMATDTAFVVGGLALLRDRIPASLRLFLLSLAIFDDVGAILIVAIGYGHALYWPALVVVAVVIATVFGAARAGIRDVRVYVVLGVVLWVAFDASGIHPTLAGVVLGLMTPTTEWVSSERLRKIFERVLSHPSGEPRVDSAGRTDVGHARRAAAESVSPVERLEMRLHPWSGFVIMPVFALANAGVALTGTDFGQPVSIAIVLGLAVGKPIGVVGLSWVAVVIGLASRPERLTWPLLAAGSLLTGIGFTMSLFIAGMAFPPEMLGAAKIGILVGSVVSAAAGLSTLTWLTSGRRTISQRETGSARRSAVVE